MRRVVFTVILLLLAGLTAAGNGNSRSGLLCTLTGKKIAACCCEQKGEKLYCPLAKKTVEKCCCKPAAR